MSSNSNSNSSQRPAFPQRRRPRGPLHPPNRPAPSPISKLSASATASSASGASSSSFVAAPTKKRNWTPGVAGPSMATATSTTSILSPLDPSSSTSDVAPSWSQQPYRSASSGSWYYDAQAQLAAAAGPSRSGSNSSLYFDAPSSSSTTSTSNPLQPPRGEFSFESRQKGTGSGTWDVNELPDSDGAGLGPGRSVFEPTRAMSNIPASPARASLQRAQERERAAAAAAAANGPGQTSASSSGITSEQALDEHTEGPAPKKRRGVAGAIVEGALHTALYAGAAAITAYTLWSSWGRRSPGEGEEEQRMAGPTSDAQEQAAARKRAMEKQTLPGTLSEEPPPPYAEDGTPMSPSPSTSSLPSSSRGGGGVHTQRVYVSSQRRRPALPAARHARVEQARRNRHAARQGLSSGASSSGAATVMDPSLPGETGLSVQEVKDEDEDEEEEGEDDEYARMSRQMAALIKEGQAALSAQVDIGDMEEEEDDVGGPSIGAGRGGVVGGLGMPKSRSTGGLGLMSTPARLKFGASRNGRGDSPLRARASTSGTPGTGQSGVGTSGHVDLASNTPWSDYALPEPSKAMQTQTQKSNSNSNSFAQFRSASQIDFDFASHHRRQQDGLDLSNDDRAGGGGGGSATSTLGFGSISGSVPPSPSAPLLGYTATNPFARHGSSTNVGSSTTSRRSVGQSNAPFVFGAHSTTTSGSSLPSATTTTATTNDLGGSTPSSSVFGTSVSVPPSVGGPAIASPFGPHGRIGHRSSPYARSSGITFNGPGGGGSSNNSSKSSAGGSYNLNTPPNSKPRWM